MGETLNQRRRVRDEGALSLQTSVGREKKPGCPAGIVPLKEGSANYVPAAAVIRRTQALSGFTGCKGCVGGLVRQRLNIPA